MQAVTCHLSTTSNSGSKSLHVFSVIAMPLLGPNRNELLKIRAGTKTKLRYVHLHYIQTTVTMCAVWVQCYVSSLCVNMSHFLVDWSRLLMSSDHVVHHNHHRTTWAFETEPELKSRKNGGTTILIFTVYQVQGRFSTKGTREDLYRKVVPNRWTKQCYTLSESWDHPDCANLVKIGQQWLCN